MENAPSACHIGDLVGFTKYSHTLRDLTFQYSVDQVLKLHYQMMQEVIQSDFWFNQPLMGSPKFMTWHASARPKAARSSNPAPSKKRKFSSSSSSSSSGARNTPGRNNNRNQRASGVLRPSSGPPPLPYDLP